jgi:hypothetical protein
MAIPWPSSPAVGDTFTYGGITYTWNGVAWTNEVTNTAGTVGSVAVTAPITNTGTSTAPVIGIDQTGLSITPSQVSGTAVITTDSRLSDARTPTAHASTHASVGSDPVTLAQSQVTNLTTDLAGKASSTHTHGNISNTGTVSTSVTTTNPVKVVITDTSNAVGTLTTTGASNTTFLRGDGTWATPAGGGSFTGGTLTSGLVLAANGTTTAPLTYQSGTLLTSVTAGVAEYDGTVFYETPNATTGRALNPATYHYASTSNWIPDFSTSNTYQSLLGGATTGITVPAGTTYEYELKTAIRHQYITNSSISGIFSIIGTTVTGSPAVSAINYVDFGSNTTGFTTASAISAIRTTSTVTFSAAITTGSRYNVLYSRGIIRVTGTGTAKIYPAMAPNVASGDNIWTISSGTTFKLTPIGNGTVTTVGTWA